MPSAVVTRRSMLTAQFSESTVQLTTSVASNHTGAELLGKLIQLRILSSVEAHLSHTANIEPTPSKLFRKARRNILVKDIALSTLRETRLLREKISHRA